MKPTLPLPKALDHLELLPYQSAFATNPSRFKIGLWARQTGKDHTAALEAVLDCLYHPGTIQRTVTQSGPITIARRTKPTDTATAPPPPPGAFGYPAAPPTFA